MCPAEFPPWWGCQFVLNGYKKIGAPAHSHALTHFHFMDLSTLQKPLLALVQQAGAAILDIYQEALPKPIHLKADHSPITEADIAAHRILTTGLNALSPYPVLSEESASIPWSTRKKWHTYWLVDPLDGTQQFIRKTGEFSVNVALIQAHAPVLGILHIPVTGETYYAAGAWGGAYKQDAQQQVSSLHVRAWSAADTTHVVTSQISTPEHIQAWCGHLGKLEHRYLSSAWKFGWLAEGKADISPRLGATSEWDTAAGQCILELAGGALVDMQGKPLRYNTHASLLNPHFIALGDARLMQCFFNPR
jgi:3'(2'), 5'-bisphosphate nucleotidase